MDCMKTLSGGSMCQLQFSIHIADGIDAGNVGLKMFMFICQDTATFHGRSKTVSEQTIRIRFSAGSNQNCLCGTGADRVFFRVST